MSSLPLPITLKGDLTGTVPGGTLALTDYTDRLETGPAGQAVDITWGRQADRDDVPPARLTFLLKNVGGEFTNGANIIDLGHAFQVTMTPVTTPIVLFTGYVVSVDPTWPGGVQSWSVVQVTCTDISGWLANAKKLRSLLEMEMLADNPSYLFPLDEAAGSQSAGDISGAGCVATAKAGKYGAGSVTFGTDMGLADATSGATFGVTSNNHAPVTVLDITGPGTVPTITASGSHSIECWFIAPDVPPALTCALTFMSSGSSASTLAALYIDLTGVLTYMLKGDGLTDVEASSVLSVCDGKPHQAVGTLSAADRKTMKLYIDGVLVHTTVAASAMTFSGLKKNQLGGLVDGLNDGAQFGGTLAEAAIYTAELTAAQVLAHYQAGAGSLIERSDQRYARIAEYGSAPLASLPLSLAKVGHQNTKGVNVIDALNTVARSENAPSFAQGTGEMLLQARTGRYNGAVALSLTSDDIDGALAPRRSQDGFFNALSVSRQAGATQRIVGTSGPNTGEFDGGSFEVINATDFDAAQNAKWQLTLHNTSRYKVSGLKVDLLSRTAAFAETVLSRTVSDVIQVTSLPSQSPTSTLTLLIEGGHIVLGVTDYYAEFNTTPSIPATLRADAAPSAFTPLDAGLKIPY